MRHPGFCSWKSVKKKGALIFNKTASGGFIERTILQVTSALQTSVSNDEIAAQKGFLQNRDPRFKLLSGLVLLIAILLSKSLMELAILYTIIAILSLFSKIKPTYFLKRTLLFIPLFSLFIVLPATMDLVTPGDALFSFYCFNVKFTVTQQGVDSAALFLLRVLDSVSISVLLMLTTRHQILLKTLRIFRVPQLFVMAFGMCYRYIYLMLDIVLNTFTAIKSRVGFVSSTRTGRRITGAGMANLWLRSYRIQTQVYDAMLSRGYQGEPRVLLDFCCGVMDFLMFISACLILIGILWLNLYFH